MVTFADLLKATRRERRLTLATLAERVGYHASYLSLVERGRRELDEAGVIRVAEALGLDPTDALMSALRQRLPEELRRYVPGSTAAHDSAGGALAIARQLQAGHSDYEVGRLYAAQTIDWDGNFRIIRSYEACRPNADGRLVSQLPFRERVIGVSPHDGEPQYPKFAVRSAPDNLAYELITRKATEWISHTVFFPEGWRRASRRSDDEFCFTVELYHPNGYVLDPAKLAPRAERAALHQPPTGSFAVTVRNFTHALELSVALPDGYSPQRWQPWVWWGAEPLVTEPRNLAGNGTCRSLAFQPEGGRARLVAEQPLAGYTFAIVWTPADRQSYLEARYAASS